ncbi:MAG: septum site-determining protein MinD [Psychrilyobacter sp.]|nr:septum site-determining protein MinD [Psychrilyobacter sp.]
MGKVYVITSGKGGVGKTTTTANLGVGLAKNGSSVVLMDADIGLRNLDVILGLENRIVYNSMDVMDGTCKLNQALIKDKRYKNLHLLPASQTNDKMDVTEDMMKILVEKLKKEFDYVLIDCPAGIEQGFKNAIAGADKAIIITTPEISAIRDADRVIGLLAASEMNDVKLIINRVKMKLVNEGNMLHMDDIVDILGLDIVGVVPDDEEIVISTNKGEPVSVKALTNSGKAYMNIAGRMTGQEIPFLNIDEKKSFASKFKSLFVR